MSAWMWSKQQICVFNFASNYNVSICAKILYITHATYLWFCGQSKNTLFAQKQFTLTITGYLHVQADWPKNKRHKFLLNFTKPNLNCHNKFTLMPIPLIFLYLRLCLVCEALFNPIFPLDFSFSMLKLVALLKIAVQIANWFQKCTLTYSCSRALALTQSPGLVLELIN
jgi:hypothetical protein